MQDYGSLLVTRATTSSDAAATCGFAARKRIGMRVLLIDDDSATAQSIELMLK
jgi:hypothetical protein